MAGCLLSRSMHIHAHTCTSSVHIIHVLQHLTRQTCGMVGNRCRRPQTFFCYTPLRPFHYPTQAQRPTPNLQITGGTMHLGQALVDFAARPKPETQQQQVCTNHGIWQERCAEPTTTHLYEQSRLHFTHFSASAFDVYIGAAERCCCSVLW